MRNMTQADLGDIRQFEDEAIREQAARLQIHADNLRAKISNIDDISRETMQRVHNLFRVIDFAHDEAKEKYMK